MKEKTKEWIEMSVTFLVWFMIFIPFIFLLGVAKLIDKILGVNQ